MSVKCVLTRLHIGARETNGAACARAVCARAVELVLFPSFFFLVSFFVSLFLLQNSTSVSRRYTVKEIFILYTNQTCVLKLITIKQKSQEFLLRVRARLLGLCSRHFFSTGRCPRAYSSDSNSTFLIKDFLTRTHEQYLNVKLNLTHVQMWCINMINNRVVTNNCYAIPFVKMLVFVFRFYTEIALLK